MKSEFLIAVTQLAAERNLPREVVISAIEAALVSVYKKEGETAGQNLSVKILPNTGEIKVATLKTVVETVKDADLEISHKDATRHKSGATVGEVIEIESTSQFAGRIAAQTAKQVVMQRLREAERELVYQEFSKRESEIASAVVQRLEPRQVILDIEKTEAVMPISEMVPTERYRPGQRLKVLVLEVSRSAKGPQVIVSRSHKNLIGRLFELEVPEVYNGNVEIRSVAREGGYRSKVAVSAKQEGIDPVGSCVGPRGIRIQNIVNELHGEKIDVVQWDKDPALFIASSLSPAQVARVEVNKEQNSAVVVVADKHLSLAIGKEGQNARLAAKLTGWRIDIKGVSEAEEERLKALAQAAAVRAAEAVVQEKVVPEVEPVTVIAKAEPVAKAVVGKTPVIKEAEPAVEAEPEDTISVEEAIAELEKGEALEEVAVGAGDEGTSLAVEEVWPTAPEERFKPASELRFAEDLNIVLPGRAKSKGKKRKSKKPSGQEAGARGPKAGRAPGPGYTTYEAEE